MDQTCQSLSRDKYSKVVPDENDDIYFDFKQTEAYKYNGTSKKVVSLCCDFYINYLDC